MVEDFRPTRPRPGPGQGDGGGVMGYQLLAGCIEFDEGGTTIWVQSPEGATMLRIKCKRITIDHICTNTVAHADILVPGGIEICLPEDT